MQAFLLDPPVKPFTNAQTYRAWRDVSFYPSQWPVRPCHVTVLSHGVIACGGRFWNFQLLRSMENLTRQYSLTWGWPDRMWYKTNMTHQILTAFRCGFWYTSGLASSYCKVSCCRHDLIGLGMSLCGDPRGKLPRGHESLMTSGRRVTAIAPHTVGMTMTGHQGKKGYTLLLTPCQIKIKITIMPLILRTRAFTHPSLGLKLVTVQLLVLCVVKVLYHYARCRWE